MKLPKFTAREQAKLALVIKAYEEDLHARLERHSTRYDNDLGCGNCGDVGPVYKTLGRLGDVFSGKLTELKEPEEPEETEVL